MSLSTWRQLCSQGNPSNRKIAECLGVCEGAARNIIRGDRRASNQMETAAKLCILPQDKGPLEYLQAYSRGAPEDELATIEARVRKRNASETVESKPEKATEAVASTSSTQPADQPASEAPSPYEAAFKPGHVLHETSKHALRERILQEVRKLKWDEQTFWAETPLNTDRALLNCGAVELARDWWRFTERSERIEPRTNKEAWDLRAYQAASLRRTK